MATIEELEAENDKLKHSLVDAKAQLLRVASYWKAILKLRDDEVLRLRKITLSNTKQRRFFNVFDCRTEMSRARKDSVGFIIDQYTLAEVWRLFNKAEAGGRYQLMEPHQQELFQSCKSQIAEGLQHAGYRPEDIR